MRQNGDVGSKGISVVGDQTLFIPGPLPGLNKWLLAKGAGKYVYNAKKKKLEEKICYLCLEQKTAYYEQAWFWFEWLELHRRRNPDNVAADKKFILDGLVKARRLPEDGWSQVLGWLDTFQVDRENPGVRVHIFKENPLEACFLNKIWGR